jgi:hypothetical protein
MKAMLRASSRALSSVTALVPAMLLLAACNDTGRVSGGSCVINQDCPTGEQCVGGRCTEATKVGCKDDEACALGETCNRTTMQCEPLQQVGCATDVECPAEQRCNTLTGVCIDGRRNCNSESDCTSIGKHCDVSIHQCVDCVQMTDCASPNICLNNSCVDPSSAMCTTDAQCMTPDTVCEATQCVPGCHRVGSPVLCGLGQVCDTASGRCVAGNTTCSGDNECTPPATICESQQCIPSCTQIGGLQCTGGNVCNPASGRCEATSGCASDSQCGAPAGVCENNQCIPGCGQIGGLQCGAGSVCDNNTGRCVTVQGPCSTDQQCGAPAGVCETGQCIPGCGQTGGLQCIGNTVCNVGSGRCDPGQAVCTSDAQCGPPNLICDLNTGACVNGCGLTGCAANEMCNAGTGRCGPVQVGGPLNSACTANTDCGSGVCFDFGDPSVGSRCVSSCGNSLDCPASFTCYDFVGAKMCISSQLFSNASFATSNGGACTQGGDCHSNYCAETTNTCVDTCSENTDCAGGACMWGELVPDLYLNACDGPAGNGTNGSACNADDQCRSGVCYGAGTCGDLCGSTADCPNGNTCGLVNYSVCTVEFIDCFQWAPNFVKACVQGVHGNGAVGTACANANQCRSGLCYTTVSQCTDICSRDADCPASHVCGIEQYGELGGANAVTVYINVCKPR